MKKIFNYNKFLLLAAASTAFLFSCKPELDAVKPSAGEANFSKYISIGNSLTAGFADGGLYLEGQQVAYPNLIAAQLKHTGGSDFKSPFFTEAQRNGSGYLRLKDLVNGQPVMENVTTELAIRGANPAGKPLYTKYTEEINNLGVPGMRLDMAFAPGIGTVQGNPFFERLLADNTPGTYRYFDFATTKDHTFFSFWLGNNDILGYATNGAVTVPGDGTTVLTSTATFNQLYNSFIDALTLKQQKGIVATIPDVTAVPYFTTVTRKALLAAASAAAGSELKDIYITSSKGMRPATDNDMFVLPFSSAGLLGKPSPGNPAPYGLHPSNPVESKYVLDTDEIAVIKQRTTEFNDIIKKAAERKGLAIADAHAYLNRVKSPGIVYNGLSVNANFITGNAFSLDGIHLTPMGNALIANLFIDAINATYNSSITKIDATQYRGVKFP
ncbi:SGNH/GDSL hydrolase family protein [Sphingobacterium psychroaquaticum]|uniref:GDSL-like Lipase/Acylhydrolase n=1 Tax=Sphingobacterium psychroaquaticum TaxID=561061 RepID=A0A1X7KH29_9SPHI|nr:SGNH/GDSL hydrolase family protein [Sphingobacterium psychroaquaticum]SMG40284.1 GDSL-like Lipase/Acylhydrolase [Sphingobacterium psychroaquaticum]